jgi:ribonuclease PH
LALANLQSNGLITTLPVLDQVAAVSCGIYNGQVLLDLDYNEDSDAGVDANFVLTGTNKIIEVQATAEDKAFDKNEFNELLQLAEIGIGQLVKLQKHALGIE